MKVLYFSPGLDRIKGGARTSTINLANSLLGKIDLKVASLSSFLIDKVISPFNSIIFSKSIKNRLKYEIKNYNPDLIHYTGYSGFYYKFDKINLPIVYTLRDDPRIGINDEFTIFPFNKYWNYYYGIIEKRIEKSLDSRYFYHCISSHIQNSLINFGILKENTFIVPNGITIPNDGISINETKLFNQLSLFKKNHNLKFLLYVGSVEFRKGFDLIYKLGKEHLEKNLKIIVVSDINKNISKLSLLGKKFNKNFIFTGNLRKPLLMKIYKLSDIVLSPSRSESFNNVVIEAIHTKTPIIMSKKGNYLDLKDSDFVHFIKSPSVLHLRKLIKKILSKKLSVGQDQYLRNWEEIANLMINNYKRILEF